MNEKLSQLKEKLGEIGDLYGSAAVLGWDQQTYMPRGGAAARGQQMATISKLGHQMFTSAEIGKLLDALLPAAEKLDPDSDDARLVKVTHRHYQKQVKVPAEWVAEFAQVTAAANETWMQARSTDNFSIFQPDLERVLELRRKYSDCFAPYKHVYDPQLDDFEPGMLTEEVQFIFGALRPEQVELIRQISAAQQVDDSFLHQPYAEKKQWDFSLKAAQQIGYELGRGRMDKAAHPFCTSFAVDDVRITNRVHPKFLNSSLFGALHETGHALYELGVDHSLERTPLAGGASSAIHESQSRMWENLVGRSLPFWEFMYPSLQKTFPRQLGSVSLEQFYKGINKVQPSLIRVEADEATYNLHIMLRLELEIAMMEGSLEVKDLPAAWNQRMQDYLGLTPSNDALGVLQDIHWSMGLMGYFATYALGNLVSAQLWEKVNAEIPDLPEQFRRGEFSALLAWLRQNVHRFGSKFEPQELVQRVTGSRINFRPYIHYLRHKYVNIYGLTK